MQDASGNQSETRMIGMSPTLAKRLAGLTTTAARMIPATKTAARIAVMQAMTPGLPTIMAPVTEETPIPVEVAKSANSSICSGVLTDATGHSI
jgi:hypothetical protein